MVCRFFFAWLFEYSFGGEWEQQQYEQYGIMTSERQMFAYVQ